MRRREVCSYRWNGTKWDIITKSVPSELKSGTPPNIAASVQNRAPIAQQPVRLATLNILADCFPWFVEMAIRSSERYEWLCKGITSLNATILGLNEVTVTALQRLQECSFIRENYFITELFPENSNNDSASQTANSSNATPLFPHGCVILSKLPFIEVFAMPVTGRKREAIVAKIQIGSTDDTRVYICSHHATPYRKVENAELRAQQIRDIVGALEPLKHPFIIMGDLNFYDKSEDAIVVNNRLIDAWAQTHFSSKYPFNDKDVGYTFDSLKNTFIPYYIPGSCSRMRLDRILFSHGFPGYAVAPCAIWANEPIKPDSYLFPSDHFGLYIDIVPDNNDNNKQSEIVTMSLSIPDPLAEEVLRSNAESDNDQRSHRVGFLKKGVAITSHVMWLGGVALGIK